jgi:hypothetical protein
VLEGKKNKLNLIQTLINNSQAYWQIMSTIIGAMRLIYFAIYEEHLYMNDDGLVYNG